MSESVKKHKNAKGKWVPCNATQRACRYENTGEHKFFPVDTTQEAEKVSQLLVVSNPVENIDNVPEPNEEEEWGRTYTVSPDKVQAFKNEIEKANRRLTRTGITEQFTYTMTDTISTDPDTGVAYQTVKFELNKPSISFGGWEFMGTVDHYINEDGEQVRTVYGVGTREFDTNFTSEDAVKCDHCGYKRARSKTYVVKNKDGEYKQVGSNCLQAFLGVKPSGLWALENPLVDEDAYATRFGGTVTGNYNFMLLNTRTVVALGLALSKNGEEYVSSGHSNSTKQNVFKYALGETNQKIDVDEHLPTADKMIKGAVFNTEEDYGRNMKTLLAQDTIPFTKIGYVVSVIPYYLRQQAVQKPKKEKAKGFIGERGEKITGIQEATVEVAQYYQSTFGYRQTTGLFMVLRTPDNKLIQWSTSSSDERLNRVKKGTVMNLDQVTVKGQDVWDEEDQTAVKNVKFSLISGYDEEYNPDGEPDPYV